METKETKETKDEISLNIQKEPFESLNSSDMCGAVLFTLCVTICFCILFASFCYFAVVNWG